MVKQRFLILAVLFVIFLSIFLVSDSLANLYEVKKGDNLYTISKKYGVSIKEIKNTNSLQHNALKPRQILDIPEKSTDGSSIKVKAKPKVSYYTVKSGDTLGKIAGKTGVSVKQLMAQNNVKPTSLRIGRKLVLSKPAGCSQNEYLADDDCLSNDDEDDENIAQNIDLAELEKEKNNNEQLLGKWNSPEERKTFIKVATGFLGAPYRMGGSTVRGIDCSAYVRKMYEFFDVNLPRTAREQSTVGVSIERSELEEGDLVFFRTRKPIGHVGIYIGNNEFVHASRMSKAIRIDSLDRPYFQKRFRRAVRVKGLDNNKGNLTSLNNN